MQIYALDLQEFHKYVSRFFVIDVPEGEFNSVVEVSREASWLHWQKEKVLSGVKFAGIEKSLRVGSPDMKIDLIDWIDRSRVRGGDVDAWDGLIAQVKQASPPQMGGPLEVISVSLLNEVVRFWLREAYGKATEENWLVRHLRGAASHGQLATFPFFQAVADRCRRELR